MTLLKWIAKAAALQGGESILSDEVIPSLTMLIDFTTRIQEQTLPILNILAELLYTQFRIYFVSYGNIELAMNVMEQLETLYEQNKEDFTIAKYYAKTLVKNSCERQLVQAKLYDFSLLKDLFQKAVAVVSFLEH